MASQMRIAVILLFAGVLGAQSDWPFHGHDAAGQRYSPLAKIKAKNASKPKIHRLREALRYPLI